MVLHVSIHPLWTDIDDARLDKIGGSEWGAVARIDKENERSSIILL